MASRQNAGLDAIKGLRGEHPAGREERSGRAPGSGSYGYKYGVAPKAASRRHDRLAVHVAL